MMIAGSGSGRLGVNGAVEGPVRVQLDYSLKNGSWDLWDSWDDCRLYTLVFPVYPSDPGNPTDPFLKQSNSNGRACTRCCAPTALLLIRPSVELQRVAAQDH